MKKTITAVAISMISATAAAQESGWYVGGAFGQSEAKDFCSAVPGRTSCDDSEVTLKAMGGYQFMRNFAVEFGLTGVGEFEASSPGVRTTITIGIAEATAVGIVPLGDKFSLFGKVGVYTSGVEIKTETIFGSNTDDTRNSDLTYGAGVGLAITPKLVVRAEWQRYQDVDAGNLLGKSDLDIVSLGMVYRFF